MSVLIVMLTIKVTFLTDTFLWTELKLVVYSSVLLTAMYSTVRTGSEDAECLCVCHSDRSQSPSTAGRCKSLRRGMLTFSVRSPAAAGLAWTARAGEGGVRGDRNMGRGSERGRPGQRDPKPNAFGALRNDPYLLDAN